MRIPSLSTRHSRLHHLGLGLGLMLSLVAIPMAGAEIPLDAPDWRLHFNKDNIQIFTRKHENSAFEAFKAVAVLNTPIENVMAVMANPNSCVEWVHGCVESWGFDEESFTKRYAYSVNDLPWPVKDRDYVLEINTQNDPDSGIIEMRMFAMADKLPAKREYVRVNIAETHYIFRPTEDGKTEMIWLQHTEPGGAIPSWLVNALIVDIPAKSMKTLESLANSSKYSNFQISYDEEGRIIGMEPADLK